MSKSILSVHDRYEHRGRRSGNTTRMLDAAVQLLFSGNRIVYITSHEIEVKTFLDRLHKRFLNEHGATMTKVGIEGNVAQWDNHRSTKRLIYHKYVGDRSRGITYFDVRDNALDIDKLGDNIAVIVELQTLEEYQKLKESIKIKY